MEVEAAERYDEFAAWMEVHNNRDIAGLFRELSGIGRRHAETMATDLADDGSAVAVNTALAASGRDELETISGDALHYLMTPHHALQIALKNEERALAFFAGLAENAASDEVHHLAAKLADEKKRHVKLMSTWLTRLPEPSADWAYDPDDARMPD
ncbi:MAG: ferritin family protein [Alphaproteobacteria bacterium]|nr:ferritin family protein [Alphaproteobacteria bacterium]